MLPSSRSGKPLQVGWAGKGDDEEDEEDDTWSRGLAACMVVLKGQLWKRRNIKAWHKQHTDRALPTGYTL